MGRKTVALSLDEDVYDNYKRNCEKKHIILSRKVEEFMKITPITGIIMTKLDGTAKGGILLAIGKKFKLPIIALGMGEKEDDLQTFNSEYFANALMHF